MNYSKDSIIKHCIIVFLLIVVIGPVFNDLLSQNIQSKPTRQSSLEAFSKGDFEKAYSEFSLLLRTYSKDPSYNYYSGVSLIKLKRSPDQAVTYLKQALQSSAMVKNIPADALFYLGRAQQMAGSFTEASESYNLFTEQEGKRAARDLGVPEFIKQCNEKTGAISKTDAVLAEKIKTGNTDVIKPEAKTEVKPEVKPEAKAVIIPPVVTKPAINRDIPASYDLILGEALKLQHKSDSVSSIVLKQKSELAGIPDSEKPAFKAEIAENELIAASLQKSADAKTKEASMEFKDSVKRGNNSIIKDTIGLTEKKNIEKADIKLDTIKKILRSAVKPVEYFSFFEVLPKPVTDPKEKISMEPEIPPGLIYRIQIAVFRNPVALSYFKGIGPVYGFKIAGTDKTGYYVGMFRRLAEANKALVKVKAKGFKDSFIVASSGNKAVSADRALILEKEWGKIPFISNLNSTTETPIDTLPPALSFRVEVVRSSTLLKPEVLKEVEKMAGNRGLDILPLEDGKFAYLIGNFITFTSAEEYANLLIRNGYPEAKVVGWLGKREIPVETARQLIENIK